MAALLHHALLGLSAAALWTAAVRVATPLAPHGPARALAAAPLATAAAVGEALALGLAGLGGSPLALAGAALLTYAGARAVLPAPEVPVHVELGRWWTARDGRERAALGALGGAALAWTAWQLHYPAIGFDSEHYHLAEIVLWVQDGHPGSVRDVVPGLPVGNYPLANETTVAWATGLARSFVPFVIWPWLLLLLTAMAGWGGLRALLVAPVTRGLAVAALCSSPWLLAWQSNGSMTDPAALAWLVCGAALVALARERLALLAPALVALGLSIGAKTTTLPLALIVAALGLHRARGRLRPELPRLAGALLVVLAVGGVWYLRNLVEHGSPFWPIIAAPWGDPVPRSVSLLQTSFLDRPAETVQQLGHLYLSRFGGGLTLLAGALLAPLIARRHGVAAAAAVTVAAVLAWALSPVTGVTRYRYLDPSTYSATRYLLPVLAAAALTLAVAGRDSRRGAQLAGGALVAGIAVNLIQAFDLGFPSAPALRTPLAGALAGALLVALAGRARGRWPARAACACASLAVLALTTLGANGFASRHGSSSALATAAVVRSVSADRLFRSGSAPVATSPAFIPVLAGDRLRHRIEAIPNGEGCARLRSRAREEWLVVSAKPTGTAVPPDVRRCLPGVRPFFEGGEYVVYRPRKR